MDSYVSNSSEEKLVVQVTNVVPMRGRASVSCDAYCGQRVNISNVRILRIKAELPPGHSVNKRSMSR
ncbi:hypothetical protein KM043_001306 [Ampulex compressa]|nr:hypothetical protein KM043_001306 [Ampulex compressa]